MTKLTPLRKQIQKGVELIGNEVISIDNSYDIKALTSECLRYVYRIFFLFYIESRDNNGLLFLHRYKEVSNERYYLYLDSLFELLYKGYPMFKNKYLGCLKGISLFNKNKMPILNEIELNNSTIERLLNLFSDNINIYKQLSLIALGEVYENLLSFEGQLATEDLYEVGNESEPDELSPVYFVTATNLEKYSGNHKKYPKGSFIYRLSGRYRNSSASFYTPECLTESLIKYSLKELLKDKSTDDILDLKICEPSLGNGASLIEAVNQLSELYLKRKQEELNVTIPKEQYQWELYKVKKHICDRNVVGVELNPIALELAELSLRLNTV